jgi:hypothetical protein
VKISIVWDIMACRPSKGNRCFGGMSKSQLTFSGVISQKIDLFMISVSLLVHCTRMAEGQVICLGFESMGALPDQLYKSEDH